MKETMTVVQESDDTTEVAAINYPFDNPIAEVTLANGETIYCVGKHAISQRLPKKADTSKLTKEYEKLSEPICHAILAMIQEAINFNEEENN